MPQVIILLAVYNGEKYLSALLDSIVNQDYENWLLVISDDQSTDSSNKIIEEYKSKYCNNIEIYSSGLRFGGACRHFLHLLGVYSDAEYIMFCDQDDVWNKDKISVTMKAMLQSEESKKCPILVHTDLSVVDRDLKLIHTSFKKYVKADGNRVKLNNLLIQNVVTGCTVMINSQLSVIAKKGIEAPNIIMHDWWLALIACTAGKVVYVNKPTISYRKHGSNSEGVNDITSVKFLTKRIHENRFYKEIEATAKQASNLYDYYNKLMKNNDLSMCSEYMTILNLSYLQRRKVYIKNRIFKSGILRIINQMFLG